jgi:hypothetical protein
VCVCVRHRGASVQAALGVDRRMRCGAVAGGFETHSKMRSGRTEAHTRNSGPPAPKCPLSGPTSRPVRTHSTDLGDVRGGGRRTTAASRPMGPFSGVPCRTAVAVAARLIPLDALRSGECRGPAAPALTRLAIFGTMQ